MDQPRTISVSQVNAYLGCPLKYRFQYVDKIPRPWRAAAMAFGTSIHAAVEWFHRERLAGRSAELTDVLKVFDADWYAQNVEPLVFSERESREGLAEKGRAMLQLYVESCNGTKPVARLLGHQNKVNQVQFSPDGTLIASAGWDNSTGDI